MVTRYHRNPCPECHKSFGRPFHGHHYYILSLSDLWLGVEKKLFKEIMHFTVRLIWQHPRAIKNLLPGGHEI